MVPMLQLVDTVLRESASQGYISAYLRREAGWEAPMRRNFSILAANFRREIATTVVTEACASLEELNRRYRTRQAIASLPEVSNIILEALAQRGWLRNGAPHFFDCTGQECDAMTSSIMEILCRIQVTGTKRPYSLLTKFLHFCFPESFPISDSQAAASIQMWSYLAFGDRGIGWRRFSWNRILLTDGSGYGGVLAFYRMFWGAANHEHRALLKEQAAQNEAALGARVTVLDLVDKMLWIANGDPLYMGLRCGHWLAQP